MPGSLTTPGRPNARDDAPRRVAFHDIHGVGTQNRKLSRLNGWPMRSPVNASPKPSRATAHDTGPMWFETPSSQGTCTIYYLPVSRRLAYDFRFTPKADAGRTSRDVRFVPKAEAMPTSEHSRRRITKEHEVPFWPAMNTPERVVFRKAARAPQAIDPDQRPDP
jgi:hypothetical protein